MPISGDKQARGKMGMDKKIAPEGAMFKEGKMWVI